MLNQRRTHKNPCFESTTIEKHIQNNESADNHCETIGKPIKTHIVMVNQKHMNTTSKQLLPLKMNAQPKENQSRQRIPNTGYGKAVLLQLRIRTVPLVSLVVLLVRLIVLRISLVVRLQVGLVLLVEPILVVGLVLLVVAILVVVLVVMLIRAQATTHTSSNTSVDHINRHLPFFRQYQRPPTETERPEHSNHLPSRILKSSGSHANGNTY